jgi:hypothetical protein
VERILRNNRIKKPYSYGRFLHHDIEKRLHSTHRSSGAVTRTIETPGAAFEGGWLVRISGRLVFGSFVRIFVFIRSPAGKSREAAHEENSALQQIRPFAAGLSSEPGRTSIPG